MYIILYKYIDDQLLHRGPFQIEFPQANIFMFKWRYESVHKKRYLNCYTLEIRVHLIKSNYVYAWVHKRLGIVSIKIFG